MAAPEQNLPGDELENNSPRTDYNEDRRKHTPVDRRAPSGRPPMGAPPRRRPEPMRNPNWYEPIDSDYHGFPHTRQPPPRKPRHQDHDDLPPDDMVAFDMDQFHEEVADNFDKWKEFQITDVGALAARELESLTDEEKLYRANKILEYNRRRQSSSINNERNFKHEKAKGWFALQMFIGYGLSSLFMIFIVVFTGLFVYTTFKDGTLSDNGMGVGILNTIQEVLRIIFSPGGDMF